MMNTSLHKHSIFSASVFLFLLNISTVVVFGQNKIAFYKNQNKLFISSTTHKARQLGTDKKIKAEKTHFTSYRYSYSSIQKNILDNMRFSEGMGLYSALETPSDNTIFYTERSIEKNTYNFSSYNLITKSTQIIFSETNSPNTQYAFVPIAYDASKNIVYLEAIIFGSSNENEGIWAYNITNKQFFKLPISTSYISTPIISPNKKYFIYTATNSVNKGDGAEANAIILFDIQKKKEKVIAKDSKAIFSIFGWVDDKTSTNDLLNINDEEPSLLKKKSKLVASIPQQVNFKLPYPSGTSFCISRTGSLAPNLAFPSSCAGTTCGPHSGAHAYQAIDISMPVGTDILSVASGTVVFAYYNANGIATPGGGYGNLVKIRHADNTYTYYAHLNQIGVLVGDVIPQGCVIGKSGNTGHSTGPHLHFEWRDVNDAKFNSTAFWPSFSEYGCTPNQNKKYISQNVSQNCSSNFALNCANAPSLICGQIVAGQTEGKVSSMLNQMSGDLSKVAKNPYNSWNDPGPEDIYKFTTTGTTSFTVSLSGMNTAQGVDLDVFVLNGCDITSPISNTIVKSTSCIVSNAPAGTYYILVDGSDNEYTPGTSQYGSYGSYSIKVDCSNSAIGIHELEEEQNNFLIFPNPATDMLTLELLNPIKKPVTIALLNVLGDVVYSEQMNDLSKKEINLNHIASGVYFVHILTSEKNYSKKVIIQ